MNTNNTNIVYSADIAFDLRVPAETRVRELLCIRDAQGNCVGIPPTVSARTLLDSRLIYWIKSYKALLKYVSTEYVDIFKPQLRGMRSGTRYEIPLENIVTFLKLMESNSLSRKHTN